MNRHSLVILLAISYVASNGLLADEQKSDEQPDQQYEMPEDVLNAEQIEQADQEPLELDRFLVTGLGMEFNQEVALRALRHALGGIYSERKEDMDKWRCWLSAPVGSRLTHLSCARNGDIMALKPNPQNPMGGQSYIGGYGTIMTTDRPVSQGKLRRVMAGLRGTEEFDAEFLSMVSTGTQPPRDIPENEEVEQFAGAWLAVGKLHKRGKSEDLQIEAIKEHGLSLKRYNRIAELVEMYKSVEKQVSEQVIKQR